jgi:RimJ/RimL family protein N-acetyltransferase
MIFRTLTHDDLPKILEWRRQCPEALRTSKELTLENQEEWYAREVVNRESRSRWWGIWIEEDNKILGYEVKEDGKPSKIQILIGYCGIENIEWENRRGEISLLIDPQYHGKGYGSEAVKGLFHKAFELINLENIYGECFYCNPSMPFWDKIIKTYPCQVSPLFNRKYWNGQYWDSLYFNFNRQEVLSCLKD